jgi:hypothetical protein
MIACTKQLLTGSSILPQCQGQDYPGVLWTPYTCQTGASPFGTIKTPPSLHTPRNASEYEPPTASSISTFTLSTPLHASGSCP